MNLHRLLPLVLGALGLASFVGSTGCSDDDPSLTPGSLPNGFVGVAYTQTFNASDFESTPEWSITAGALPPGLEFAEESGSRNTLSGQPLVAGSFVFELTVEGGGDRIARFYRLTINGGIIPLEISTTGLPNGRVGLNYDGFIAARGGRGPYTWTASNLAAGLSIGENGTPSTAIRGIPTEAVDRDVLIQVTDADTSTATAVLRLEISNGPPPLQIVTTSLPGAVRGVPYEATVTAMGGTETDYVWFGETLPEGLTIVDGTPSGTIMGTPTQEEAGQTVVEIAVADSGGVAASRVFTLTVSDPDPVFISQTTIPDGAVDVAYSETVRVVGGVPPYSWRVSSGALPPDLALSDTDSDRVTISGTPRQSGTFTFALEASDSLDDSAEVTYELFIVAGLLEVPDVTPPTATAGEFYTTEVTAVGGVPPYTWAITSGDLPAGLSLVDDGSALATVSGTPLRQGTFDSVVEVTDDVGATADTALNFVVGPALLPLLIETPTLADARPGEGIMADIVGAGGTGLEYAWRIADGTLPPGIVLSSTGTPSTVLLGVTNDAGDFDFTVELQDSAGTTAQQMLTITSTTATN